MFRIYLIVFGLSLILSCSDEEHPVLFQKFSDNFNIINLAPGYKLNSKQNSSSIALFFNKIYAEPSGTGSQFYLSANKKFKIKSLKIENTHGEQKFKLFIDNRFAGKYKVGGLLPVNKNAHEIRIIFLKDPTEQFIHAWQKNTIIILGKKQCNFAPKISLYITKKHPVRLHVRRIRNHSKSVQDKKFVDKFLNNSIFVSNGIIYKKNSAKRVQFSLHFFNENVFYIYQLISENENRKLRKEIFFTGNWTCKKILKSKATLALHGELYLNSDKNVLHRHNLTINVQLKNGLLVADSVLSAMFFDFPEDALINVKEYIPTAQVSMAYATNNNFTGIKLYPCNKCFLRYKMAKLLQNIQQELQKQQLSLKFFDCYRPYHVQAAMFEKFPIEGYVANPQTGSIHNRGLAVDLTIVDKNGKELDMGTGFDDLSRKANHTYTNLPDTVLHNRLYLKNIMVKHGFLAIRSEWWHYNYKERHKYPIIDDDFLCD